MHKYTVLAYNEDTTLGAIEKIEIVVRASSETEAIRQATKTVQRTNYSVIKIELSSELKKQG